MAILAVIAMMLTTVAIVPAFRNGIKDLFLSDERVILAKLIGDISPEGPRVTVLKIKDRELLSVEIYTAIEGEGNVLLSRIPLFESRDGYFILGGNATNLALTDIDKDGLMEIVAPTYNDQMVPRLNIFKYNRASKGFDRVNAPGETDETTH